MSKRDYNKEKAEQLGMAYGTASNRLRKMILFSLVKETQKDTCFQCGKKIDSIDNLSIEHKIPWFKNDAELFWDLENIAFSHLKCNVGAARKSTKIIPPDNKCWCWKCKEFKDKKYFSMLCRNKRRSKCTKCNSAMRQEYRKRTGKR